VNTKPLRLHAAVLGEPSERPPVLLLHGFTGSAEAWGGALLSGLAARRRVIALDLPGHGRSRIQEGEVAPDIEETVALVGVCLDELGVERADWIGYSMGGRVALAAAVLSPGRIRRLVLESASPGLETEEQRATRRTEDEALASHIEERGLEWFVDHWMGLPLFESQRRLPAEVLETARERRLANDPRGLALALRRLGTGSQPDFWPDLPLVEHPTLLITGGRDTKYEGIAERMGAGLPDVRWATLPSAGHTVHLEAPGAWLDAVTAFLDRDLEDPDQG
jgi:2-succinyl-6-hydroxy-2,4-cyclohexadiene-1-carboxylate synthase